MIQDFPDFDPQIAAEFGYAETSTLSFLGIPVCDTAALLHLLMRFVFHLLVCFAIVHFCYYRHNKNKEYYKTFIFFATAMFLLLFLLESVKLQIGLTLGLFAIFGVIRYRTEMVPIKEMTYLFMVIAVSVINGLSLNISYVELIFANLIIIAVMAFFEYQKIFSADASKLILYEKIELICPDRRPELLDDLTRRTGLEIHRVEVGHIDFLRDVAFLKIYYKPLEGESCTIGSLTKIKP